jgi:hypothetical protein
MKSPCCLWISLCLSNHNLSCSVRFVSYQKENRLLILPITYLILLNVLQYLIISTTSCSVLYVGVHVLVHVPRLGWVARSNRVKGFEVVGRGGLGVQCMYL